MSNAEPPPGYEPVGHEGFNAYVGPILRRAGEAGTPDRFLFEVQGHHLNGGGFLHGGMLMALAEVVLDATVSRAAEGAPCAAVSLNCDFVSAGKAGDRVEGEARIIRQTRSVVFVAGELYSRAGRDERRTLMTATGIWKVSRR